jgi:hypothetical protein
MSNAMGEDQLRPQFTSGALGDIKKPDELAGGFAFFSFCDIGRNGNRSAALIVSEPEILRQSAF